MVTVGVTLPLQNVIINLGFILTPVLILMATITTGIPLLLAMELTIQIMVTLGVTFAQLVGIYPLALGLVNMVHSVIV